MTGNELQALRRHLGLTPAEAAEHIAAGITPTAWNRYESGARGVPADIASMVNELVKQRRDIFKSLHELATGQGGETQFQYYRTMEDGGFNTLIEWKLYQSALEQLFAMGLCSIS